MEQKIMKKNEMEWNFIFLFEYFMMEWNKNVISSFGTFAWKVRNHLECF